MQVSIENRKAEILVLKEAHSVWHDENEVKLCDDFLLCIEALEKLNVDCKAFIETAKENGLTNLGFENSYLESVKVLQKLSGKVGG